MSQRPPLLPEEQDKRSTQPAKQARTPPLTQRRAGFVVALVLLVLLLSVGWLTTVIVIGYRPDLIGYEQINDADATAAGFARTAESLADQSAALVGTAQSVAAGAVANAETLAALQNREALLNQSATQAAVDGQATQAAQDAESARQATQAAVDFAGTQAAFDRQATQAEIQFQGTQAALNRDATAVALGFATAPPDTLPTFAPPPTPLFSEGFAQGIDGGLWNSSSIGDWDVGSDGALIARETGAWLLTQRDYMNGYGFVTEFFPLQGTTQAGFYYVLLNVTPGADGGVAVEVFHDGAQVTAVSLYAMTANALNGPLWESPLVEVARAATSFTPPDGLLRVQVEVRGATDSRVVVYLDGTAVLDVTLPEALPVGAVGVSLPAGTRLEQLTLLP